ncbi:MAG: TonB-dependent receptor [Xanthomonadales bacterium]|nr:TonB-dependent receptor [Xanthomonadales bacterium]
MRHPVLISLCHQPVAAQARINPVARPRHLAVLVALAAAAPWGVACSADDAGTARDARPSAAAEAADHTSPMWVGDTVEVSARGTAADWPDTLATSTQRFADSVAEPADLQDLLIRTPGVGATGQNGIFETFSIRGSGANGILVLAAGMPVTAQRRAGVPVSFVEPFLQGDISVTRGPAVVHFGAGAMGGAVSVEPRWFGGSEAKLGYASAGDETVVAAGTGGETYSIAVAHHQAGESEAANGTPLNTGFDRLSGTLQWRRSFDAFELDALLMPSRTTDIGKSNSRYPNRNTIYPEDVHTLGRLRLRHDNGFQASIQGHDQRLETWNRRPGSPDTFAFVASTDVGAVVQQTLEVGPVTYDFGIEYLGRRDVDAFDASGSFSNRNYSLRGASEDGWSLFAIGDVAASDELTLEFGARQSWVDQDERGAQRDDDDHALTAGAVWRPADRHRWSLNLASGYRFATLEERFFTGVTAQGEVVGNPQLGSERSQGIDLGYGYAGASWRVDAHLWRSEVDDLIQLVELGPDTNGYTNIGEADLHGAEISLEWRPTESLTLQPSAWWVRSKDAATNAPLYGSPPPTMELAAHYRFGAFELQGRYQHRQRHDRPGFEEVERDAVDVVDAALNYQLRPALRLQLFVRNLFDEDYFATADELSARAPERSIGLNLTWSPD